jgi:Tissue inhibitor of metalloproteinase
MTTLSRALAGALMAALLVLPHAAAACLCTPTDVNRSFDGSTDVVRVRIRRAVAGPDEVRYRARVMKSFKGETRKGRRVTLVTPADGALCGVTLERGDYVVTATKVGRRLFAIDLCGFNRAVKDLTDEERGFLKSGQ